MNMYVRSQDGNMVPIGTLAHLGPLTAPSLITLYNLYPSSTIIGAPATLTTVNTWEMTPATDSKLPSSRELTVISEARAYCETLKAVWLVEEMI